MPDNCKLISSGSGIDLIKKASAVLGFNTTGIIESSILNKTTIVPLLNIDLKSSKKYSENWTEIVLLSKK